MADCAELELSNKKLGCMLAYYGRPRIVIDNLFTWLEWFIIVGLTHESIHLIIYELVDYETADNFDNWFGMVDPSVLLVPEDDYWYNIIQRERTEKLWERLEK